MKPATPIIFVYHFKIVFVEEVCFFWHATVATIKMAFSNQLNLGLTSVTLFYVHHCLSCCFQSSCLSFCVFHVTAVTHINDLGCCAADCTLL